jgi:hypothetical protein
MLEQISSSLRKQRVLKENVNHRDLKLLSLQLLVMYSTTK